MAIYKRNIRNIELDGGMVIREILPYPLCQGDDIADLFGVTVYQGGEPVDLSGVSCHGYFIRPDDATVAINGTVSESTAYVTLPDSCYVNEGHFSLAITLSGGGVTGTMRIVDGMIAKTTTETIVDPGTVVPSLQELLAQISACESATTAAEAVTTKSLTTDDSYATSVPQDSDFDDYTTPGNYKVTNNTTAGRVDHIPVALAGRLVVMSLTQSSRILQIYFVSSNNPVFYTRTKTGDGWQAWITHGDTEKINNNISRLANGMKAIRVNYGEEGGEGLGNNKMSECLKIDIFDRGLGDGFIRVVFGRCVDEPNNANVWRIVYMYSMADNSASESGTNRITTAGEWECALHLLGRSDFSGGITHGDEVESEVQFFVDGNAVDLSYFSSSKRMNEIKVVRTSILYDPADHTTQIAEHGVEYIFSPDEIRVRQSIKWLVAEDLENCFLAMFPIRKSVSKYCYADTDFSVVDNQPNGTDNAYSRVYPNAKKFCEYTPDLLMSEFEIVKYPTGLVGGNQGSVTDNNGNDYNKCYFKVCGEGESSSVNELWQSETVYRVHRV